MLGKPAVLSFWFFSNNVSGLFNVSIVDKTSSRSFVAQFSATAGVVVKVVIPIPALPSNLTTTFDSAIGLVVRIGTINYGTFQSTSGNLNTWQTGQFMTGPTAGTAHWPGTIGNLIAVTEVQLESGSAVTPFERRLYGHELAMCQRYYETGRAYARGFCASGTGLGTHVYYRATKRAAPTVTFPLPGYINASAAAASDLNGDGFTLLASVNTAGVDTLVNTDWTSSAEL